MTSTELHQTITVKKQVDNDVYQAHANYGQICAIIDTIFTQIRDSAQGLTAANYHEDQNLYDLHNKHIDSFKQLAVKAMSIKVDNFIAVVRAEALQTHVNHTSEEIMEALAAQGIDSANC